MPMKTTVNCHVNQAGAVGPFMTIPIDKAEYSKRLLARDACFVKISQLRRFLCRGRARFLANARDVGRIGPMVSTSLSVLTHAQLDAATWDAFVATHAHGHLLQTSRWGELKTRVGWQVERVALSADGALVAGAQILFRRTPWGQPFAYVPKGPVVDWEQPSLCADLLRAVEACARRRRSYLLKLEPDLPHSLALARRLTGYGFTLSAQTVQPRSTVHVDLTVSQDQILARMKQKWRYNIRLAGRKGVTVRPGTEADLPAFQRLLTQTGARDGFGVHSPAYYAAAFDLFTPPGLATWLLAEYQGELLAGIVVFALGQTAWYLWGASGDSQRQLMPNHALQWAAMQWAQARGCTVYDLWGIPDEVGAGQVSEAAEADAGDESAAQGGLWGVWRFKQGFGGQVVRYVGAWDKVLSRPGLWMYRLAAAVKRQQARWVDRGAARKSEAQ